MIVDEVVLINLPTFLRQIVEEAQNHRHGPRGFAVFRQQILGVQLIAVLLQVVIGTTGLSHVEFTLTDLDLLLVFAELEIFGFHHSSDERIRSVYAKSDIEFLIHIDILY